MSAPRLISASGLRPASAFVLVGAVLALVGLRAAKIALADDGEQPPNLTQLPMPPVTFDLVDAHQTPLAIAVDRLELVMSPNAMWQAHTPERMARLLAQRLGAPYTAEGLLERLLPDRRGGVIHAQKDPLCLDIEQARRVHAWLQRGTTDPDAAAVRIEGMWVQPSERAGEYEVVWDPACVLSEAARDLHRANNTIDWTRRIADGLIAAIYGDEAVQRTDTEEELDLERRKVWAALMPTQYKSVIKEVSPQAALSIFALLKEERVQKHQMELVRNKKRMYPVQGGASEDPPAEILGRWGTLDPDQARMRARADLMLPDDAHCTPEQLEALTESARVKVYQPSPMWGIELAAQHLLERAPLCNELARQREEYLFLANQVPRQPASRYFKELTPASPTPRVVTSIDMELQRFVRLELERTLAENDPVLAQAVVLEVATGRVLAVDAVDNYEIAGFTPLMHTFTPGSTMKAIVMATALDEGVVTPDTVFKPFGGHFKIGTREIHEAEGQKKEMPYVTAAEGLAYSLNGVLVQVGLRVPAEKLRQRFVDLGYAQYPKADLGGERCGMLPALPWKESWAHASVCFGHEMFVTLWQHAAALSTVVRGGEYLPLSLVDRVEQGERSWELPRANPRRVFGTEACEQVRRMMMLGAREGTGARVYTSDIVMGTKTGTAQKVPGEVCLHVEAQHHLDHPGCTGERACRTKLAGQRSHKSACYTSSMCIWGHLPFEGDAHADGSHGAPGELMVLVVVDEPRKGKKFGADVAGPAAIAILKEALGLTRNGTRPSELSAEGFAAIEGDAARALDQRASSLLAEQPWMESTEARHAPR